MNTIARVLVSFVATATFAVSASAQSCPGNTVKNGGFSSGLVPGSMPGGAVSNWSLLTASPQVVSPDGCDGPGAIQMWGNLVVGESIQQSLSGPGIVAGKTYCVSFCYRWLDNNPNLPQYVRFRLTASSAAPGTYPPISTNDVVAVTPNTNSTAWIPYMTFWTAPNNASWITINPENDEVLNDGNFVSWGQVDDLCVVETSIANGDFSSGLVAGSMPGGAVDDWSLLTASPQVVTPDGCSAPGALQMWGNLVVGESIQQQLPGAGIQAGTTYRLTFCYRWLNNNPNLPQYVRFRVCADSAAPGVYPPVSTCDVIGISPNTNSTSWIPYTTYWTAPNNASWLTVNPENDEVLNDGNFVSWGQIDDLCLTPLPKPPLVYCTSLISSAGCQNVISTSAPFVQPNSGASDYDVTCSNVQGFKNGLLVVGISGPTAIPFGGGLLCVQPPIKRGPLMNSGGTGPTNCDGSYATQVNNGQVVPLGLDAGPGASAWYQYWYRDPQAIGSIALSNAIQLDFQ